MVAAVDWISYAERCGYGEGIYAAGECHRGDDEGYPTMKVSIETAPIANHVPHLYLRYDPAKVGITTAQVQERLRAGNPGWNCIRVRG